LLSGSLSPDSARKLRDTEGKSIEEVRVAAGMRGELEEVRLPLGYFKAFLELHIEQGPVLDLEGIDLGFVTKIAAPASAHIFIEGSGGHAGSILMPDRRDALCAASELILAIESAARNAGTLDTVATVGICDVFPGAVNSIPNKIRLSLDVRDTDLSRRDKVLRKIDQASLTISRKRDVTVSIETLNADEPADCAPSIIESLCHACEMHRLSFRHMISRAYHDSLFISRIAPVGMLFIPCRNGYSHRPDEYASPEAVAHGTLVLADTLASLSA
jgi:ureidoglycolate amidohydrolase